MEKAKQGFLSIVLSISFWILLPPNASAATFDHQYRGWSAVLNKFVSIKDKASTVNYKLIKDDSKDLESFLSSLQSVTKADFNNFSENEKLAFLINAYNAFTIKLIVDHYPVKSIKDISGVFSSPWKIKFFKLLEESQNLDGIEHEMIRKWFNEPRIHFAVVCASIGCPALRNEAYVGGKLDQHLEDAAHQFLTDPNKNKFNLVQKQLELSSIFKWYGADFIKKFGSVENFVGPRITNNKADQDNIRGLKIPISYLEYDWSLNETK